MLLLLLACAYEPTIITVSGVVTDGLDSTVGASEVELTARGPAYEVSGTGTTDGRGWVEVEAIGGSPIFLTVAGDGYFPTGFSGSVGLEDMQFDDGDLWARSEDAQAEVDAEFSGCAAQETATAVLEGEMRHNLPGYEVDGDDDWPIAHEGFAYITDADGVTWEPCYLDDDGAFDDEATVTGQTGRFAIYGDFSGQVTLTAGYEVSGEPYWATQYSVHVPEGGVAPMYPVYVALPE